MACRRSIPKLYDEFVALIPEDERGDLLKAYTERMLCDDPEVLLAGRARVEPLRRPPRVPAAAAGRDRSDTLDLGVGRLESHYMAQPRISSSEDQLLRNVGRIAHLPAVIVQGRYDVICPPRVGLPPAPGLARLATAHDCRTPATARWKRALPRRWWRRRSSSSGAADSTERECSQAAGCYTSARLIKQQVARTHEYPDQRHRPCDPAGDRPGVPADRRVPPCSRC